ncbi:MAG: AAA family ATPase [Candidatus Aminicenantes bacterium]|nr:AAA family ATPase [Candidatus Aminicenantes bacterium]
MDWSDANAYGCVFDNGTVIDVDDWDEARTLIESLPETLAVASWSGGAHLYLRGATRTASRPLPGIDTRSGKSGYVFGPGSVLPGKGEWNVLWLKPIADMPQWVSEQLKPAKTPAGVHTPIGPSSAAEALLYVPCTGDQQDWLDLTMSYKAAGGEHGPWDEWCRSGPGYDASENLSRWNSIDPEGGLGPGLLINRAKAGGWVYRADIGFDVPDSAQAEAVRHLTALPDAEEPEKPPEVDLSIALLSTLAEYDFPPTRALLEVGGKLVLPAGDTAAVFADPGTGKTWLTLFAVASAVGAGGRAVFMDAEDSPAEFKKRMAAVGLPSSEDVLYCQWPLSEGVSEHVTGWLSEAGDPSMGVVVVDTLSSTGGALNTSSEFQEWYSKHMNAMARTGAAVVLVSHTAKSKEGRYGPLGSIGIEGKVRFMCSVSFAKDRSDVRVVTKRKDNNSKSAVLMHHALCEIHLDEEEGTVALAEPKDLDSDALLLLQLPDGEFETAEAASIMGRSDKTAARRLDKLADKGWLDKKPGKAYQKTSWRRNPTSGQNSGI